MTKNKTDNGLDRHLCQQLCQARCCRYITIHIPAPRRRADFDELGWFLAHEHIGAYFAHRHWHLEVRTPCAHLTSDNLCAIYETRPAVCRDHDPGDCEFPAGLDHTLSFETKEQFDDWWERKQVRARESRRQRSRSAGLP